MYCMPVVTLQRPHEGGPHVELVLGSGRKGLLHVQEAVVAVQRPAAVDAPGGLQLDARVDPPRVLVEHAAAVGVGEGQDEVPAVDVEEVHAVAQPPVEQLLAKAPGSSTSTRDAGRDSGAGTCASRAASDSGTPSRPRASARCPRRGGRRRPPGAPTRSPRASGGRPAARR